MAQSTSVNALRCMNFGSEKMKARGCSRTGRSMTMNPSQATTPEQLFGACMHAGGWPKLGWQTVDTAEEIQTCYDDIVLL